MNMLRPKSDFKDDRHYKRYCVACGMAQTIKDFMDSGYIVFDERLNHVRGVIEIPLNTPWSGILLVDYTDPYPPLSLLDFVYDKNGKICIDVSTDDIIKKFENYNMVKSSNIESVFNRRII